MDRDLELASKQPLDSRIYGFDNDCEARQLDSAQFTQIE
jgi:hypothetical protein